MYRVYVELDVGKMRQEVIKVYESAHTCFSLNAIQQTQLCVFNWLSLEYLILL